MRASILSLVAIAIGALTVVADDLDAFRQRDQLLTQKWTRDVSAAVETSLRLERTDPASARGMLEDALTQLKSAAGLDESVRAELTRRLQGRLAGMSRPTFAQTRPAPTIYPQTGSPTAGTPAVGTPIPNTFSPASPPLGGVADTARNFVDRQKKAVSGAAQTRDTRAAGFSEVFRGVQSSAIPADRDMAFSPNHKEIAAKRTPVLNPKEEAVMTALGSTIEGDFTGMNLRQALDYIHQKTGLVIIPDGPSLKEANVDYDDPVNFKISGKISVRAALRKILGDRGLSYIVSEAGINVVTVQRARETTVVRVYNVRDLVTPIQPQPQYVVGPFGGLVPVAPGTFPPGTPGVTPSFSQAMGQTIAEMVRTSVDPTYWAPTGPGTVTFNEATGSLIVRASAEVHFMVNSALYRR